MGSPTFDIESGFMAGGARRIAGVDEVGRGPLAGPVTAAAVVLDPRRIPDGLDDSKKLGGRRRAVLYETILASAEVSVAHASVAEIDRLNILRAAHLAMRRAVAGLGCPPDLTLIDGNLVPEGLGTPARAIIRGDALSLSIAAASIIAKVTRDRIMQDLAQQFPGYGWQTNSGYGSQSHIKALQDLGPTPHHRRSFKPVHNILYQEKP